MSSSTTPTSIHSKKATNRNQRRKNNPNELFVGNLSYFCEEQHLYDLFSNIIATCEMHTTEDPPQLMSHVSAVRIIYSDGQPQRSLMFGFVTTHNINDATYAAQKLQGSMFMGRKIKVQFSNIRGNKAPQDDPDKNGFQIHVAFQSNFLGPSTQIPNEEFLRQIFDPIGDLIDVAVKEYSIIDGKQEGYAFVTFAAEQSAERSIQTLSGFSKDGITLDCTWSHRSNHLKKAEHFFQVRAASMGMTIPTAPNAASLVHVNPLDSWMQTPSNTRMSSSPPEQSRINMLLFRNQANGLPDSLRPAALDMGKLPHKAIDELFVPPPSPASVLLGNSMTSTELLDSRSVSNHFSGLYSGNCSKAVTPTSISTLSAISSRESTPRYSQQRSGPPCVSAQLYGDCVNTPSVGSYRGPGALIGENITFHPNNGQQMLARDGSRIARSPMYNQQPRLMPHQSSQGYPQGHPLPPHHHLVAAHTADLPLLYSPRTASQVHPHQHHMQNVPYASFHTDSYTTNYDHMHNTCQHPSTTAPQFDEFKISDGNHSQLYHDHFFANSQRLIMSNPTRSLSAMAIHGKLENVVPGQLNGHIEGSNRSMQFRSHDQPAVFDNEPDDFYILSTMRNMM